MIETHRPKLSEIEGNEPWSAAEERLMEVCGTGEFVSFGKERPSDGTESNTIRAGLIRHILLGGCKKVPVHVKGVRVQGAWITGVLDLESCNSPLDLVLDGCHFCDPPELRDAQLGAVMLLNCGVPGLSAHRLKVTRGILLNQGFNAQGPVNLSSAAIGGTFDCVRGTFDGKGNEALNCEAMMVGGNLLLQDGFVAVGAVLMRGAQIKGQFSCANAAINGGSGVALNCDAMTVGADVFLHKGFEATGQVFLVRAKVDGNLHCSKAKFLGDLVCEGMRVSGGMYWKDVAKQPKEVDLTDVHVGTLLDDMSSWNGSIPVLNGFRYDRILSEMSISERLAWLDSANTKMIERGSRGRWYVPKPVPDVDAQPYTQFAGALDGQGRRRDAAAVRFVREKRVRKAQNAKWLVEASSPKAGWLQTPRARLRQFVDGVFGAVFGYGHRPMCALLWVAGIWASCFWLYGAAYDAGQMAPNSDVVLTSRAWLNAAEYGCAGVKEAGCDMPLHLWNTTDTATDYETFNRGLYALDLFVPLDALGQENAWAPSKDRGALGKAAYYLRWLVQMSGWVITAVGAAALTGVIGRKE